jgi:hypothetical protein
MHLKKLFLIDGFGALLSAFLLGVVLVEFNDFFGIPVKTLYFLAFLPCLFALYDFYCYFNKNTHSGIYLKTIAFINIAYCILSLGFALYHHREITILGWGYIILEIIIVLILANIELKVARNSVMKI